MNKKAALLDTSFFLRFLNEADPLFKRPTIIFASSFKRIS